MKSASLALAVLTFAALGAVPAVAQSPAPAASEWRTPDPENVLVFDTNKGRIIVEMSPATAPMHVERYRTLTRQKFFDGLKDMAKVAFDEAPAALAGSSGSYGGEPLLEF